MVRPLATLLAQMEIGLVQFPLVMFLNVLDEPLVVFLAISCAEGPPKYVSVMGVDYAIYGIVPTGLRLLQPRVGPGGKAVRTKQIQKAPTRVYFAAHQEVDSVSYRKRFGREIRISRIKGGPTVLVRRKR